MRGPLEGAYDEFPLSTDQGITTRDRYDCMGADLVVFNLLGADRITIGTMIELGWADAARNPAILVMEKSGNVHDHPMVRQATHFRVDNIDDAIAIAEIVLLPTRPVSDTYSPLKEGYKVLKSSNEVFPLKRLSENEAFS